MSSVFNFSGLQSPPRRLLIFPSAKSPFCTSPSQLQDITLDQDDSMDVPRGPMGGRSVKEFEEQMSSLKKENFNLKLRIYFLEERMGSNFDLDKENIIKKNVELMVDVETYKKEVQEKHNLLCQAVKAMELEEEEHKKISIAKDELIRECQQEIECLKTQMVEMQGNVMSNFNSPVDSACSSTITEPNDNLICLQKECAHQNEENAALHLLLDRQESKLKLLTEKMENTEKSLLSQEAEVLELQNQLEQERAKFRSTYKRLEEVSIGAKEVSCENNELRKRNVLQQEQVDAERKRYEKMKSSSETKIAELQTRLEVSQPATASGVAKAECLSAPSSPLTHIPTSPLYAIPMALSDSPLAEQIRLHQEKIVKLKAENMKACTIIKNMIASRNKVNEDMEALKRRNEQLLQERGNTKQSTMERGSEMIEKYKGLTDQLEEKNQILEETLTQINIQLKRNKEHYEETIAQLKQKIPASPDSYNGEVAEKEAEIVRLRAELKRKTSDLQGLVNNELWDKNREIEKLQKRQLSKVIEAKDEEILQLQQQFHTKDAQLSLLTTKIAELGFHIDLEKGNVIDNSDKLRTEAKSLCISLTRRLEEMAMFLNTLLREKAVLGFLGSNERKRLRQLIDESMDFSQSFSMSMALNPEASLIQLSNISTLLNETEDGNGDETKRLSWVPENASLTYRSHLYRKSEEDPNQTTIIDTLRQQVFNLQHELQLRDVELNKLNVNQCTEPSSEKDSFEQAVLNTTSTTLKPIEDLSESEAWSEPDRSVSRARIGLFKMNKSLPKKAVSTDSTTEEEATGRDSRTPTKKTITELYIKLSDKEKEYLVSIETNEQLQLEINNLRVALANAEASRNECAQKVENLETELLNKEQLEQERALLLERVTEAEEAAIMAKETLETAVTRVQELTQAQKQLEASIKAEYEVELLAKVEECDNLLETIKHLQGALQELRDDCTDNYVKKCEVKQAVEDCEKLSVLVEDLEKRIEVLSTEERRAKELEDKVNSLRESLDDATLQYSEAVLEKAKIASEKEMLEHDLSKSALKELDFKKRVEELDTLRHTLQCEQSQLKEHKLGLELRISELESSNAELHNKLVKLQAGYGDQILSTSMPNFVNQIVSFRRQNSMSSEGQEDSARGNFHRLPNQHLDVDRMEANSSPDLGIESDQGRFSSLETHMNVHRPLLQTLELTESMSNMLDQSSDCGEGHCCNKILQVTTENTELKRKLLRTRRALQETVTQLKLANQRKKQVEKNICKQISETSEVLRKAKANLDSGSETDLFKK